MNNRTCSLEKVSNGFILRINPGQISETLEIYADFVKACDRLLHYFEGRSPFFHGDMYGKMSVDYVEPKPLDACSMTVSS